MIVLTDCDGVLADFVGRVCEGLRFRGFDRSPDDFKHFELAASLNVDEMRVVSETMMAPGFVGQVAWYEGAREFLRALATISTVHAVTAPFHASPSWMYERMHWFAGELPSDRIHFVSGKHKHMVRGDVLVEDHPGNAREWLDAHPKGMAILIDRPWNQPGAQEYWPHPRMIRARSYAEAVQAIREMAA